MRRGSCRVGVLAAGLFVFLLQVSAQDTVPTLQDTMNFIANALNSRGTISWTGGNCGFRLRASSGFSILPLALVLSRSPVRSSLPTGLRTQRILRLDCRRTTWDRLGSPLLRTFAPRIYLPRKSLSVESDAPVRDCLDRRLHCGISRGA